MRETNVLMIVRVRMLVLVLMDGIIYESTRILRVWTYAALSANLSFSISGSWAESRRLILIDRVDWLE